MASVALAIIEPITVINPPNWVPCATLQGALDHIDALRKVKSNGNLKVRMREPIRNESGAILSIPSQWFVEVINK